MYIVEPVPVVKPILHRLTSDMMCPYAHPVVAVHIMQILLYWQHEISGFWWVRDQSLYSADCRCLNGLLLP